MGLFNKIFSGSASIAPSAELMPDDQFWNLIEQAKDDAHHDYKTQQTMLKLKLAALPLKSIQNFENTFRKFRGKAYSHELWGAAYLIHGGCFEEHFVDFRAWLIAQGRDFYYDILENPELLANIDPARVNIDWSGIGEIASEVFAEISGQSLNSAYRENMVITGEPWDEFSSDLKKLLPQLWTKYGPKLRS